MRTITSHASVQGTRERQEDRSFINSTEDGLLIAVFDGHGGSEASDYCRQYLTVAFDTVGENSDYYTILDKMRGLFLILNEYTKTMEAGTTASIVFIPSTLDRAYVGVLGDSPVIIRNSEGNVWKSPEHNVRSNPVEVAAAKARGAVILNGYMFGHKDKGLNPPGLQLTRGLGDVALDDVLIRTPEIFEHKLAKDSFVLVASDGLIDPSHGFNDAAQRLVELISRGATAGNLIKHALDAKTDDNATAVLVRIVE